MIEQPDGARRHERLSFSSLLDVHERIDRLFRAHQEAVLYRHFERAQVALEAFQRELFDHMAVEENELFPIYERSGPVRGATSAIIQAEHDKLRRYLAGIARGLADLRPNAAGAAARTIELLDFEARFKNLLAHHDERERAYLYPALDRVATDAERRSVLAPRTEAAHSAAH